MELKITKGEWVVSKTYLDGSFSTVITKVTATEKGTTICDIWGMDTEEGKANAKLIAAAPDLLEACITLIQQAEVCNYQTSDGLHQLLDNLAVKEIRAAIKKSI